MRKFRKQLLPNGSRSDRLQSTYKTFFTGSSILQCLWRQSLSVSQDRYHRKLSETWRLAARTICYSKWIRKTHGLSRYESGTSHCHVISGKKPRLSAPARSGMIIYVDRNGYDDTSHQNMTSEASLSRIKKDLISKSCFLTTDGRKLHACNSSHNRSYLPEQ